LNDELGERRSKESLESDEVELVKLRVGGTPCIRYASDAGQLFDCKVKVATKD